MTDLERDVLPADEASVSRSRFSAVFSRCTSRRWFPWLVLGLICLLAIVYRCLHLLQGDYYFILSPDSHFFHRMAELIASGDRLYYPTQNVVLPFWQRSGLAYPIGLLAKALAFVTGMASPDAVNFVSKCLPPAIGVITIVVLWLVVSKMYRRMVAHLAAFAWAVAIVPLFFGAAGYVDRDGISLLLTVAAVSVFYLMKDFHLKKGGLDFGWIICGACVLVFEAVLFVEWISLGPIILLVILVAYVVGEILTKVWTPLVSVFYAEEDPLNLPWILARAGAKGLTRGIRESSYKPVLLVLAISAIVGFFRPGFAAIYDLALGAVDRTGAQTVGELQGIGPGDILGMQLLIVPLVVGLYVTIRKRRTSDILWLSWFVVLFAAGLFARRLFNFASPAFCVLCGIGLGAMLDIGGARRFSLSELGAGAVDSRTVLKYVKAIIAVVLIAATLILSGYASYTLGSPRTGRALAVPPEWQEALTWLRENTPEDGETKIMTWWDYGYWILDLAQRVPVVDNGVHWESQDRDIATVYCAENDDEAVEIMHKHGARYLIFSELDIQALPVITLKGLGTAYGDGTFIPRELKVSLFSRSLNDQSIGAGLRRVYPAIDIEKPSVVILSLE